MSNLQSNKNWQINLYNCLTQKIFALSCDLKYFFFLSWDFTFREMVCSVSLESVKCKKVKSVTQNYKDVGVKTTATRILLFTGTSCDVHRHIKRPQTITVSDMLRDKFFIDLYLWKLRLGAQSLILNGMQEFN